MADIGPGPLICVRQAVCGCGEGITKGCLYQCEELVEPNFLILLIVGLCGCGELHPYVKLRDHQHVYCPTCFVPLGDPDAEVKETSEPKIKAPLTLKEWIDGILEPHNV